MFRPRSPGGGVSPSRAGDFQPSPREGFSLRAPSAGIAAAALCAALAGCAAAPPVVTLAAASAPADVVAAPAPRRDMTVYAFELSPPGAAPQGPTRLASAPLPEASGLAATDGFAPAPASSPDSSPASAPASSPASSPALAPAATPPRRDGALAAHYAARQDGAFALPAIASGGVDSRFLRQEVAYPRGEAAGTIVVDPTSRFLYLVQGNGRALRYGVGVGREGFAWAGSASVGRKAQWPRWTPTAAMVERDPERYGRWREGMDPGLSNPLGPRALYLYADGRDTLYRIHGTNEPRSIGKNASSGCIRMFNQDVIDLYGRVSSGARVVVLPKGERVEPAGAGATAVARARPSPAAAPFAAARPAPPLSSRYPAASSLYPDAAAPIAPREGWSGRGQARSRDPWAEGEDDGFYDSDAPRRRFARPRERAEDEAPVVSGWPRSGHYEDDLL